MYRNSHLSIRCYDGRGMSLDDRNTLVIGQLCVLYMWTLVDMILILVKVKR